MTRYNDDNGDKEGDFDDQITYERETSYREGVRRVLTYIESIHAYPKLVSELRWAIDGGII